MPSLLSQAEPTLTKRVGFNELALLSTVTPILCVAARRPPFENAQLSRYDGACDPRLGATMRRWEFIALLGCAIGAWPFAAQAQHSAAPPQFCGWIGAGVGPMTTAFANSLGLTELYGGIFKRPQSGGPAAHAGIETGDVITAINGAPLRNWRDFASAISKMAPGTIVHLTTYRDRQLIDAKVTLGYSKCHPR
jgi:PDZ domain